ncbi:MAG TPA: hypothetical protein VJZ91_18300, partial [Blastocatellia bacterium]|nr:hypothetical protein [Blastocatellia bacterium]
MIIAIEMMASCDSAAAASSGPWAQRLAPCLLLKRRSQHDLKRQVKECAMHEMNGSEDFTTQHSPSRSSGSKLDNIKTTVADKLNDAADALRQKSGQGGAAAYAGQASDWLTNAADYVRDV